MSLIAKVGRKSWKVRLLLALFYGLLIGGGITMVYPFMLMIANSITSNADWNDFRLVPKYLYDKREQFRKYMVEAEHQEELPFLFNHGEWFGAEDIKLKELEPLFARDTNQLAAIAADWVEYMKEIPCYYWRPYFNWQTLRLFYTPFVNSTKYQDFLKEKYSGNIEKLNHAQGTYYNDFSDIWHLRDSYWWRLWSVPDTPQWRDWTEWKATIDPVLVYPYPMEMEWWKYTRFMYISVHRFNDIYKTNLSSLVDIHLDDAIKFGVTPREDIEKFVFEKCNSMYYELHTETSVWNKFLKNIYDELPKKSKNISFEQYCKLYPPVVRFPTNTTHYAIWTRYINQMKLGTNGLPVYVRKFGEVTIWSPIKVYREFLRKKYKGNIQKLNNAYGKMYVNKGAFFKSFDDIKMLPVPEMLFYDFTRKQKQIFRTFLFGNYATVINYIALHGRSLWVTLIFIILCIASSLTVNPMAAYALSRFRLSYANKILIFFLATMAFPAEVAMIPNFLMIRDLGLLNTFGALILPGLANGFGIFLLKGFFDSLPPELYEAALIDGASEWKMFYSITLPLCKPILAVMALGAFTGAYGAFMFAFLVCQDKNMWTLMVFLYQFQQEYGNFMIMASLVLSAIPTLIIFILCQRIILRGIVIPTFK